VAPSFFTSALDRGEWLESRPCRLTTMEAAPGADWIEGWMGSRAGLDVREKRTTSCPYGESNSDPSVVRLVAYSLYKPS
jgi:hypothetical protein